MLKEMRISLKDRSMNYNLEKNFKFNAQVFVEIEHKKP